jgi:hypothetical protein
MLLNISFEELKDFFTIILWISIPVVVIASGIAIFFHYRKKKTEDDFSLAYAGPEDRHVSKMEGLSRQDIYDKNELMQLLRKYEQDLAYHSETHEQLKQEFNELEEKYMELLANGSNGAAAPANFDNNEEVVKLQSRLIEKDQLIEQLEEALSGVQGNDIAAEKEAEFTQLMEEQERLLSDKQLAIERQENELNHSLSQLHLLKGHVEILENEKRELNKQLEVADKNAPVQIAALERKWQEERSELIKRVELTNSKLETVHKENEWLKEQVNNISAMPAETEEYKIKYEQLLQQYAKIEQESEAMKSGMANQQYMEDVVQEKKLQIEFLQNQLEHRIKSFRDLEKQYQDDTAKLKLLDDTSRKYETELQSVTALLQTKEQEFTHFRETSEKTIGSKITHIELLEREMGNLQQQNNVLNTSLDDTSKANTTINKQLNQQTQRISELESKLEVSSQLFIKIYKELSRSFEGTMASYPFINGNGNGSPKKLDDNNLIEIISNPEKAESVK